MEEKMALRAIDIESGRTQSAEWFYKNRKKGKCEVCDAVLELRAEQSITTSVHLWHGQGSVCPTIIHNRKLYCDLPASAIDNETGLRMRQIVKDNAYLVYNVCNALVEGLKYAEFKSLISKATAKNIWSYKGLQLNYVPYLLLTFHDMFYAKGSKMRDNKYYIILEPSIKNLDDLWNKSDHIKQYIWKISPEKGVLEKIKIKATLDPEPRWFKEAKTKLDL